MFLSVINVLLSCSFTSCTIAGPKIDKYNNMFTKSLGVLIWLSGNQILDSLKRLMDRRRLFWDVEGCSVQKCVLE